jgi:hypothetical protein
MGSLRRALALQDAAKGVQHLHSKSIVHGDLVSTTARMHARPLLPAERCLAQQQFYVKWPLLLHLVDAVSMGQLPSHRISHLLPSHLQLCSWTCVSWTIGGSCSIS